MTKKIGETNIIYAFLVKGFYTIEIILNERITNKITYLKTYCYEEIKDNNMIYNNIINVGKNFTDVYLENNFILYFKINFIFLLKIMI